MVSQGLEGLIFEEKQKLLRLVVEKIVVEEGKVRVEAIIPLDSSADFLDIQGKVHTRASCDFDNEFETYLCCPLEYEHCS